MRICYRIMCYRYINTENRELISSHIFRSDQPIVSRRDAVNAFDLFEQEDEYSEMDEYELHLIVEDEFEAQIGSFPLLTQDCGATVEGLVKEVKIYRELADDLDINKRPLHELIGNNLQTIMVIGNHLQLREFDCFPDVIEENSAVTVGGMLNRTTRFNQRYWRTLW